MDGSRINGKLETEVTGLLSRYDRDSVTLLDDLISDCAAKAMRAHVRRLRTERVLDKSFDPPDASGRLGEHRRWLLLERKRLLGEEQRLEVLMGSLRMHRDRIEPPSLRSA